jgi:hypothetical protein
LARAIEDAQCDRLRRPRRGRCGDDRGRNIGRTNLDFPQYRLFGIGPGAEELDPIWLRAWDVVSVRLTFRYRLREGPRLASLARIAIKHEEGIHLQLSREIEADAAARLARDRSRDQSPILGNRVGTGLVFLRRAS